LVRGTGHGATLWGLLMFPHPLPARVGDQEKIVWRMTGLVPTITLLAIGPDGSPHRLLWGPEFHAGSNFDKPGDEWARATYLPSLAAGTCAPSAAPPPLTSGLP
jgi:hypothetical protein